MKFCHLLTQFRERARLSKTDLSRRLDVSSGYIINLEAGRQRPPTIKRLEQIINTLSLSKKEAKELLDCAGRERIKEKDRLFFEERPQVADLSPEILEALQDPIAVKALIITHKNSQDIKNSIKALLDCLPTLTIEKRQAILALCR
jgi:transcriptional regulator with XRE-family HTH domain